MNIQDRINTLTENLEQSEALTIRNNFQAFIIQAEVWEKKALQIVVTDASQKDLMKQAREGRLELKNIRVAVEKLRKKMKEEYLRKGNTIQAVANFLTDLITPIEAHLELQEKFVEIQERERIAKLKVERSALLEPYVINMSFYNVEQMTDEAFNDLLETSKLACIARKEAAERAEQERIDAEIAAKAEQERIKAENERLRAEAAELEKKNKAEQAARDAEMAEEKAKNFALSLALDAKIEAEKQAAAKIEAERQAAIKEQEKLEKAPDIQKIKQFIEVLKGLQYPTLKDQLLQVYLNEVMYKIAEIVKNLNGVVNGN
jgi:hypothetical protein